jgi:hypothetical protein
MIGRVTWDEGGWRFVATLHEDGRWAVDGPPLAAGNYERLLEIHYADSYRGPSDGPFGVAILNDLAADKGGTVELEPKRPAPAGAVF